MKIASAAMSLGLGIIIAWVTLLLVPAPKSSGYAQMPPVLSLGPIDDTDSKALLAVGLLSKKSVMDSPEKKELQPTAPPPDVAENKPLPPVPKAPVPPPPADGPQPTAPASTDMSTVPPAAPQKAPQMPSPMPPSPTGPQPSSTGSSTYAPAAM